MNMNKNKNIKDNIYIKKYTNLWRLNNTLLNGRQNSQAIYMEIKNFYN